jgi:acyl-homoserine-lactone acylase
MNRHTAAEQISRHLRSLALLLPALLTIASCASAPVATGGLEPQSRYRAEIVTTDFGIPHVTAADFGGLGYGLGYAYAQHNFCMLAEKINQLNGERSRYFGPEITAHVGVHGTVTSRESDFFHRSQFSKTVLAAEYRRGSADARELTEGYAAGINRYLRETGVANLPAACRGAAWVRPITDEDLYLWYTALATLAASQPMLEAIVAAQPPATPTATLRGSEARNDDRPSDDELAGLSLGSNAWAFGREASANGRGLLLGNPHWPWGDMNQFYQAHLTIPGTLDVMGATAGGMPGIVIGFNQSLAWSHTVSTGPRYVLRELQLADDSPTTYIVDGKRLSMRPTTVTIDVLGEDGVVRPESRTLYSTEFGPIIVRKDMPWNETTAYALTDLNLDNRRLLEQWLRIATASNVSELHEALTSVMGVGWLNTLAADANGGTLYADYSIKPYVTEELLERCGGSETARRATRSLAPTLDGSRNACDPLSDPAAPRAGVLPPRLLPQLEREDYVANSNNSYWLTNASAPITGLPRVNGSESTFIGFRPQSGLRLIEARLAGRDALPGNRFDADAIKALVFGHPDHPALGNHNRAAEVMRGGIAAVCADPSGVPMPNGETVDIGTACDVLTGWDLRHSTTSVGGHLFRELWTSASRIGGLWSVPFDPANPLETPRGPDVSNPDVHAALRRSIAAAAMRLASLGIPLDRPWGGVHAHPVNGQRLPVAGNDRDVLNLIVAPELTAEGYGPRIVHGTSYVQIVGFDRDGPVADAVLLFGQSTNPASPYYFDQLQRLWVEQRWNRLPFTQADIAARTIGTITIEE